jgi:hypothetical protein
MGEARSSAARAQEQRRMGEEQRWVGGRPYLVTNWKPGVLGKFCYNQIGDLCIHFLFLLYVYAQNVKIIFMQLT